MPPILDDGRLLVTLAGDGGRILSVRDLAEERELLGPEGWPLPLTPEAVLLIPGDEGDALVVAGVREGLYVQVRLALAPGRGVLEVEIRVCERDGRVAPYDISLSPAAFLDEGDPVLSEGRRALPGSALGPLGTDLWRVALRFPADATLRVPGANASLSEGRLVVYPETAQKVRLFVGDATGRTLEAVLDLDPAAPSRLTLPGPGFDRLVLETATGRHPMTRRAEGEGVRLTAVPYPEDADARAAAADPALRPYALLRLAREKAREAPAEAAALLERGLLAAGDHPDLWALLAMIARRTDDTEHPALANLHYLWPLEPVLRAEAFLAQPMNHGREGSPLLAPLADAALVRACLPYALAGLWDDATRVVDDALRHRDLPLLRYLAAAALAETRMAAEEAMHVAAAERAPHDGPLPPSARPLLRRLAARHPEAVRLSRMSM